MSEKQTAGEVRSRTAPREKVPSSSFETATNIDNEIDPDLVLVFKQEDQAQRKKSLEILSANGFYVTLRNGAANTVLVLIFAAPKTVEGSRNRENTVLNLVTKLQLPGVIDSFIPLNSKNPRTVSKMAEVGTAEAVSSADPLPSQVERVYGADAGAAFEFVDFMLNFFVCFSASSLGVYYFNTTKSSVFAEIPVLAGCLVAAAWNGNQRLRNKARVQEQEQDLSTMNDEHRGTSSSRRALIRLAFVPTGILLFLLFSLGLLLILALEIFCTQFYAGPLKPVVALVPVGANIVASQIFSIIYSAVIDKFIKWEDYPTLEAANDTRDQRNFYLQALLGYLPVLYTAYLYLPFGNLLAGVIPHIRNSQIAAYVSLANTFKLQSDRLLNQSYFYTRTQPLISLLVSTVLPPLSYLFKRFVLHQADQANNRFALEQLLQPFESKQEIQFTILSFGYVLILSSVWPLAAVSTTVIFIIRRQMMIYLLKAGVFRKRASRRPYRDASFLTNNLQLVLLVGSIVAPTIGYLYGPNSTYFDASSGIVRTSWSKILLIAFVSENVVLGMYRVLSNFIEIMREDNFRARPLEVKDDDIKSDQEPLWRRINSTAEPEIPVKSN